MSIPENLVGSSAFQFITSRGWTWRNASSPNIELEHCPYCKHGNYHLRMEVHGDNDDQKNRDGLHLCMKCGKGGSLYSLKQHLGVVTAGIESRKDWSGSEKKMEEMPDIEALHQALLADEDAMDYLMNFRGFSREIIERQKIGFTPKRYFRETGEVRALVYPYLVNGNAVFAHFRTLPDMNNPGKVPKAFSSLTGWDVPLYNGEILRDGLKEVFMVEGEPNCIAAMDKGVANICGVPGANFKKAEWIDTLDKLGLEKIYICYDRDKVGQKAAQEIAKRIGVEQCWKLVLPEFMVTTDEGVTRAGKDLNEWFTAGGGTAEEFERLKQEAVLFDVDGVASSKDSLSEFEDELNGRGAGTKYATQWPTLNALVGFDEGDVIDFLAPEKIGKTTFALNFVEHMVDTYGEDGIIICLEMTRAKMARKWVSFMAQIEDNIPKTAEQADALTAAFKEALPRVRGYTANREGDLYFCYPKYTTTEDIYTLIRDCIRRYGVKWIVIDNIQRLADSTPRGSKNRTEHLSEISKITSQIAKDYGVQMVRILQPNRIQGGKMVTTDNVDGASQIAKDCDCMITLHRNRIGEITADQFSSAGFVQQEASFGTDMLTTVGLSRYSSGGYTTLYYDGARSTVRELTGVQVARIQARVSANVGYEAQLANLGIAPRPTVDEEIPI